MKKFLIYAAVALSLTGFSTLSTGASSVGNGLNTKEQIKKKISTMTLEEKVGQMMFFGVQGTKVDDKTVNLFENQNIGGVILYSWRNFTGKPINENIKLINDLKKANSRNSKIPLSVAIDEEGGFMTHLPQELLKTPSKGELGNFNDPSLAEGMGASTAKKLKLMGINTDFGTVLDINTNPQNPIIGVRAFGATKERVTEYGLKEISGIQKENVVPTVKHFPGHGDTVTDSHYGLPSLEHDLDRLRSTELVPFKAAIDNGVDMLMTAHIMLPKIDSEYPATMSKKILTDLLRGEMGYNGVIITDDLEMEAIKNNWGLDEAAINCVNAGVDILLVCHTVESQELVYNSIVQAVNDGKIDESRIDESVERILTLKGKYNLSDKAVKPTENDFYEVNNYVYENLSKYNQKVVDQMYK